jgi:sec-independent protein translocase protein TatA
MFNIGPMELVVILVIALVVLGPKKLPEAGRSMGTGMREFKNAISGHDRADAASVEELPSGEPDADHADRAA